MFRKVIIALGAEAFVFGVILFGAAGTLTWPAGWWFLGLMFAPSLLICARLAHDDPALLKERMSAMNQKGQPLWDKIFLAAILAAFVGWVVLMGLDARFGWSLVSMPLPIVGGIAMVGGLWFVDRVFAANTFAAPVVKAQKERGQKVIDTGPYAVVRHPMYLGGAVFLIGCALVLGSWWGVLGALVLIAAIAWRSIGEERILLRELEGYAAYRERIHYRLVPGLW
jgi:protein-S-isoprenylcysteine O-methyltransferase Ste14